MDTQTLMIQLLTMAGYLLPNVAACVIGVLLLANQARPGVARSRGFIGIGLLIACLVLQVLIGAYQIWLYGSAGNDLASLKVQIGVLSVLRFVVECASATGIVLLVAGLCRASRDAHAVESMPSPGIAGQWRSDVEGIDSGREAHPAR